MGLRRWVADKIGDGDPDAVDPDELVEVMRVPLHEGPLLVSALETAGFTVKGVELRGWHATRGRMLIFVEGRQVSEAVELLTELRSPPGG